MYEQSRGQEREAPGALRLPENAFIAQEMSLGSE